MAAQAALTWKTHDISSLLIEENDNHVSYATSSGTVTPLETILKDSGANNVKLRIWVNPSDGNYGLDYALELGQRAQNAGLTVTLNLHYSDTWADPSHQTTPTAWADLGIDALVEEVKNYTTEVANKFASAGIDVTLIGIGNEIRAGMLWPLGKTPNFDNLSRLLTAAAEGVQASSLDSPAIMIHTDNGYDWSTQEYFYDSLISAGFDMSLIDVQGVSYYPFYSTSSTLDNFETSVNNMVSNYGKKIVVVETDWPVTCSDTSEIPSSLKTSPFSFSPAGQTLWVQSIADILADLPDSAGAGLMYWEPGWIDNAALGSSCSDNVLFTGDWSDANNVIATARSSVSMLADI